MDDDIPVALEEDEATLAWGEVQSLLDALKAGIEAKAVGVVDGRRAEIRVCSEETQTGFWDAFREIRCLQTDWGEWDRQLLIERRARANCACGRHAVDAFLIHRSWILIVLASGPLVIGAEEVVANALNILARLLPATGAGGTFVPPFGGGPGGGGQGPAELGIPVSWIRRRTSG